MQPLYLTNNNSLELVFSPFKLGNAGGEKMRQFLRSQMKDCAAIEFAHASMLMLSVAFYSILIVFFLGRNYNEVFPNFRNWGKSNTHN